MKLNDYQANAYKNASELNKKNDKATKDDVEVTLYGFKKFSDAIPENGFQKSVQKNDAFEKKSASEMNPGYIKKTIPDNNSKPVNKPAESKPVSAGNSSFEQKAFNPAFGKESVYRRVAKFLVIIGEEEAAKVLPFLSEDQIEKIIPEIATIRSINPEEKSVILTEFKELRERSKDAGGYETAREMLEKTYGKKRAQEMLQKTMPYGSAKPFEYLNDADNEKVYLLLKEESEGTQSIVLSHLEPKKAAAVINLMKPDEKKAVVLRLAQMEKVSQEVVHRIDVAMHEKSLTFKTEKTDVIDGRNALAQILKRMDYGKEKDIINVLTESDSNLGEDLRARLFTIDDVLRSDDRFIQNKLRNLTDAEIIYLIADKSDEFRQKILLNVSANRKSMILSDEDTLKPFKKAEVDRITNNFILELRTAYDNGTLRILGRNDDKYV